MRTSNAANRVQNQEEEGDEDEEQSQEEDEFFVERTMILILDRRRNDETGEYEYFIQWKGYSKAERTWEP